MLLIQDDSWSYALPLLTFRPAQYFKSIPSFWFVKLSFLIISYSARYFHCRSGSWTNRMLFLDGLMEAKPILIVHSTEHAFEAFSWSTSSYWSSLWISLPIHWHTAIESSLIADIAIGQYSEVRILSSYLQQLTWMEVVISQFYCSSMISRYHHWARNQVEILAN